MKFDEFKSRFKSAVRCWIGTHNIPEKYAIMEGGAVFRGGLCTRCFKTKIGKFIANCWDESQTEVIDGACLLKGINPKLRSEGWIIADLCQLESLAELLRERRKKGKKIPQQTAS